MGGNPLFGLYRDVPLDRVWFFGLAALNRVYNLTCLCPKKQGQNEGQGLEMEAVVLHRVGFLEYFCPKQGQDFKPSAAPIYPNMDQVPPPPGHISSQYEIMIGTPVALSASS